MPGVRLPADWAGSSGRHGRLPRGSRAFGRLPRDQILAESDALMDLIRRLEAPRLAEPMGVALARLLLTDPVSPIYEQAEPGTLYMAVRLATAAMGVSVERSGTTQRS